MEESDEVRSYMKTIGLIGGMSWESSALYYKIINEEIKTRLGGLHSARCIMYSVDFHEIESLQRNGDWDRVGDIIVKAAKSLELAGADFILICANTMQKVAERAQDSIGVPLLQIADITADNVIARGINTVGLLGTCYTMEQDFYKSRLEKKGIKVLIPNEEDREIINKVIFQELCLGDIRNESRMEFKRIIKELIYRGVEGIILGCTELGNLVTQADFSTPLFDTTVIHAKGAVDYALETIEYRRLTHEDYGDILDISKHIWDGCDYLPMVFHKWVDEDGYFLGAVDTEKNKVIGVGKFSILYDGSGWLEGLRVHKDYRGRKIARQISERLLDLAKGYLREDKIKKIAFSTHISNTESITLMKKLNFKVKAELLIVTKPHSMLNRNLKIEDFKFEEWKPSFGEFVNLPYLKHRSNILPLAFYFQEPTLELYKEYVDNGNFVSINGYRGIYMFKESPYFECVDETYEAIDTYMDYYLIKFSDSAIPSPATSLLPKDESLIKRFKQEGYESWAGWQPDYLYFVYDEKLL